MNKSRTIDASAKSDATVVVQALIIRRLYLWLFFCSCSCFTMFCIMYYTAALLPQLLFPHYIRTPAFPDSITVVNPNILLLYTLLFVVLLVLSIVRAFSHPGLSGRTIIRYASSLYGKLRTLLIGLIVGGSCGILVHSIQCTALLGLLLPRYVIDAALPAAAVAGAAAASVHMLVVEPGLLAHDGSSRHVRRPFVILDLLCSTLFNNRSLFTSLIVGTAVTSLVVIVRILMAALAAWSDVKGRDFTSNLNILQQIAVEAWINCIASFLVMWMLQLMQRSLALLVSQPFDFSKVLQLHPNRTINKLENSILLEAMDCSYYFSEILPDIDAVPSITLLRRSQFVSSQLLDGTCGHQMRKKQWWWRLFEDSPVCVPLLDLGSATAQEAVDVNSITNLIRGTARTAALHNLNRIARSSKEHRHMLLLPSVLPLVLLNLCTYIDAIALQVHLLCCFMKSRSPVTNEYIKSAVFAATIVSDEKDLGSTNYAVTKVRTDAIIRPRVERLHRQHNASNNSWTFRATDRLFGSATKKVLNSGLAREIRKLLVLLAMPAVTWIRAIPSHPLVIRVIGGSISLLRFQLGLPRHGCGWGGVSCLFSDGRDLFPQTLTASAIAAVETIALLLRAALKEDVTGQSQHSLLMVTRSLLSLEFALREFQHSASTTTLSIKGAPVIPDGTKVSAIRRLKVPASFQQIVSAVDDSLAKLTDDYGDVLDFQCRQVSIASHQIPNTSLPRSKRMSSEGEVLMPQQLMDALYNRI